MLHWYNVTMYLTDAKAYLDVIKDAEQRRAKLLPDDPDAAYDQWLFHDAPFINELCIVFLVALRHHVEHRLTFFAACAADGGKPISRTEFSDRMKQLSKPKAKWDAIEKRLHPDQCVHYQVIEALQHLANAYKHNANLEPDHREFRILTGGKAFSFPVEAILSREGLSNLVQTVFGSFVSEARGHGA